MAMPRTAKATREQSLRIKGMQRGRRPACEKRAISCTLNLLDHPESVADDHLLSRLRVPAGFSIIVRPMLFKLEITNDLWVQ